MKSMYRYVMGLLLLALAANAPATAAQYLVGFSQCNLGEPWRQAMNAAIAAAAAKHADLIEVEYADAQQDNAKQVAQVEAFLVKEIDLLIISPNEAEPLTPVVQKAYDQGIPVIVLDRDLAKPVYDVFIGADNYIIGQMAGAWAVLALNGKGNIVELTGLPGAPPMRDRRDGFHSIVDQVKGIRVIAQPTCDWLREKAFARMSEVLQAHQDIDLVYGHNDPAAIGAYLAAKEKGREKEIKFIGIDALHGEGLQEVKKGTLDVTFWYPTCGAEAVEYAVKILQGELTKTETRPNPVVVTLGTAKIDQSNVDEWLEALKPAP